MVEAGFFSIELDQIQLALSTPFSGDGNHLRMDVEILNGPEDLRWIASGTSVVQSEKMVPFYQAPMETDVAEGGVEGQGSMASAGINDGNSVTSAPTVPVHKYIVGFAGKSGSNNFNRRSTYLSLSSEAVSQFANATLSVKCVLMRDAPPPPVETKKGAPPPVVVPAEEVLTEVCFPLSALVRTKGSVIAETSMPLETATVTTTHPDWQVTATHPHAHVIGHQSTLSWRVAADNDLAEYLMGGSLITFHASLPALPLFMAPWTLHCADVTDPKAKVQPTEADQRKKWIENIDKMVAAQGKYATYSAEIVPFAETIGTGTDADTGTETGAEAGAADAAAADAAGEVAGLDESILPRITLAPGTITFNGEMAAAAAAADENPRLKTDLWTLVWGASPLTFLHRATVRRMLAAHRQGVDGVGEVDVSGQMDGQEGKGGKGSSRYTMVMRKVSVAPEGVASEGSEELRLVGEVDIAPVLGLDARYAPCVLCAM